MRGRNVPVAKLGGFVVVEPGMNASRRLLKRCGEIQIRGCVVYGIAAENDQQFNLPRVQIVDQILERRELVHRIDFDRLDVGHRLAHVAERRVERVREGVDKWRLILANHNERGSAVRRQVASHRFDPACRNLDAGVRALRNGDAHGSRQLTRNDLYVARAQRQTMVRHNTGARSHALDHIEPVQLRIRPGGQIAARSKFARIAGMSGTIDEKIRVQRNDDVCLIEMIDGVHGLAEREARPFARGIAPARLVLMPLRFRKPRQQFVNLHAQRRRSKSLGEQPDSGALQRHPLPQNPPTCSRGPH